MSWLTVLHSVTQCYTHVREEPGELVNGVTQCYTVLTRVREEPGELVNSVTQCYTRVREEPGELVNSVTRVCCGTKYLAAANAEI